MFQVGDMCVHPDYGAGVVTDIKEMGFLGNERKRYYSIALLSQPETTVMVAVRNEERVGLRSPISRTKLRRIWHILRASPRTLPSDHKKRNAMLQQRLDEKDILETARILRDLAWRKEDRQSLTVRGKRLYEKCLELLASEVAGAQGSGFDTAEAQIADRLDASLSSAVP